ncbi:TetR/AcrR family transcriptional regulator C-terminal domain-containing protein [Actinoplanes sp. NPDC049681]|uniref:TetR/AcrR family transcriptional regulator C-terminal domain-containing protein n=1 Tax=Actinoplanes sp. NPDC049681 TaxID=3363905 RepID=UPI0037A405D2
MAHRIRRSILRHPWMTSVAAGRPNFGPNSLAWHEYGLAVMDDRGLTIDEMLVANEILHRSSVASPPVSWPSSRPCKGPASTSTHGDERCGRTPRRSKKRPVPAVHPGRAGRAPSTRA